MAVIHGKDGYVIMGISTAPSSSLTVDCIDSWSLAFTADAVETTGFGTSTTAIWKTFAAGLKSATGNAAGSFDDADARLSNLVTILTMSAMTTVACMLYMDASHYFSVACIVTGFTINETLHDKTTFSFDFTVASTPVYG